MTQTLSPTQARTLRDARFWDRMAARYSRSPISDQASYERKLEMTRAILKPDMDVLEFGCGTGSTAIEHAPHVRQIRAIDISAKMLEIAANKADTARITNLTFEQCTLNELTKNEQTYDVVMGMSILHLVDNMAESVESVYSLLKPGGCFISSTPCLADSHGYLRPILPVGKFLRLFPGVSFFSNAALEECFDRTGFDIETRWQPGKTKAVFIVARKPEIA